MVFFFNHIYSLSSISYNDILSNWMDIFINIFENIYFSYHSIKNPQICYFDAVFLENVFFGIFAKIKYRQIF